MTSPQPEPSPTDADDTSRSRRALIALGIAVVLGVWGVAAALTAALAYQDLDEARTLATTAERELRDAELTVAREQLEDSVVHAGAAATRLNRFHLAPLRLLPVVGPNLRTATTLSEAARDTGGAAADVLGVAHEIVHDDREAVLGEISLDYLGDLAPVLRVLADTLEHATDEVEASPQGSLLGPIARARATFLDLATPAVEQTAIAADLAEVLPAFLGAEEPRQYLLAAGALSELRGSGGLMGSWTLLTASAGHLDVGLFRDVDDLGEVEQDVAHPSEEFIERYARFGSLRQWRNTNLTPDFPSAAQAMLSLWEAQGGQPLDGVIMADPVTFERLAERADGLEVEGVGSVTPEDTLQFVALDAYAAYEDDDERKLVLGGVAAAAFAQALQVLEDDDVPATVEMLADLADGGHLRVFSTDERVQPVLERAGVGAQLPGEPGEVAGVFVNNVAANKVDWFTHRSVEHRVRLLPDGMTASTIDVTFDNQAPTEGYPRHVLGPWTDHTEAGDNLSLVSFLCGVGCEPRTESPALTDGGTDSGHPLTDLRLRVPAGEQRRAQVHTRTREGWTVEGGELVVRVTHLVQPTLHGTDLTVRVKIPTGWEPVGLPDGVVDAGDELVLARPTLSGTEELELRLRSLDAQSAQRAMENRDAGPVSSNWSHSFQVNGNTER